MRALQPLPVDGAVPREQPEQVLGDAAVRPDLGREDPHRVAVVEQALRDRRELPEIGLVPPGVAPGPVARILVRHRVEPDDPPAPPRRRFRLRRPQQLLGKSVAHVRADRRRREPDRGEHPARVAVAHGHVVGGAQGRPDEEGAQPALDRAGADRGIEHRHAGETREHRPAEHRVRVQPRPSPLVEKLSRAGDDDAVDPPQQPVRAKQERGLAGEPAEPAGNRPKAAGPRDPPCQRA